MWVEGLTSSGQCGGGPGLRQLRSDMESSGVTMVWSKRRADRLPHHGRGGSRHIGRTRIRLAKILSECLGLNCEPEDLSPTQGRYRCDKTLDIYTWEVFTKTKSGIGFVAGSFSTMGDCVKAGAVTVDQGEISPVLKQSGRMSQK